MKIKLFFAVLIMSTLFFACKTKQPTPQICPENLAIINKGDTVVFENCSKNYLSQRWEITGGGASTEEKIRFSTQLVGEYSIKLFVKNDFYADEFMIERKITVVNP